MKAYEKKLKDRIPFVIVPDSDFALGIEDPEGNQVHRFVVYRQQAEDVIKACRKKGVPARVFDYDK